MSLGGDLIRTEQNDSTGLHVLAGLVVFRYRQDGNQNGNWPLNLGTKLIGGTEAGLDPLLEEHRAERSHPGVNSRFQESTADSRSQLQIPGVNCRFQESTPDSRSQLQIPGVNSATASDARSCTKRKM
ncbi:hypothetical protein J6590_074512 [Homalodisca vitripennis]|nr:hypothetical protein J6590_074512 [Homalodisca vitripennis]